MTTLWVDAGRGAAGDMLLAALWDAGADATVVRAAVRAVVPADVSFGHEVRDGFRVARAHVVADSEDAAAGPDRRWADIRRALATAPLAPRVRDRATAVFAALAQAEATIHGTEVDRVHFHEVGAHDSIADVVGVVAAVEQLGVTRVVCTPVGVGGGEDAAGTLGHGRVPAPVPAVLHLATAAGAPVLAGPGAGETCTPTGMALLVTLADAWGPLPPLRPAALGAGAGTRETPGRFGALRVVLGAPVGPVDGGGTDVALVTSTNVDDMDPRLWPRVLARLLEVGAQDAWLAPILMKKGRPAHTLHVLSDPEHAQAVRDVVVRETSAIGMRVQAVAKHALPRDEVEVVVDGDRVRVKRAWLDGRVVNAQPEWEDVAVAAARTGAPAKQVLARAAALAQQVEA
ncbi:nickel pincer cofactor biosynthesis protein LarC [Aquipuribacter hungaricus]|uniref:Pyridinium-3,5-bisthiocarboxylic acid mononucleotide nickel insertion protein n=1 Tax=Aquipuribacter hungaricus TaxID=545624 RepID=A0ABV7WIU5_9MICO